MQNLPLQKACSQVWLLFYKPSDTDPFQNRLVAKLSGPFCHVEIAFAERVGDEPWEKKMWGSSVYQGESVFFTPKLYRREGYVSFTLEVTRAQLEIMKAHCRRNAQRAVPFNRLAMYMSYLPWQLLELEGTFCSKHVTEVLQSARLHQVQPLNASLVTPSSLYSALVRHQAAEAPPMVMQTVPSMMTDGNRQELAERLRQKLLANLKH